MKAKSQSLLLCMLVMSFSLLLAVNAVTAQNSVADKYGLSDRMLAPRGTSMRSSSAAFAGKMIELGDGVSILLEGDKSIMAVVTVNDSRWHRLQNASDYQSELQSITQTVYRKFKDDFDFIFYVLDGVVYNDAVNQLGFYATNIGISNDVQGIGRSVYSDAADWGSAGKLKSALYFPSADAIFYGPALHELAHNWVAFVVPTFDPDNQRYDGHWGISNAGGQLGGFRYIREVEQNSGGKKGRTKYQASFDSNAKNPNGSFKYPGFGLNANGGNRLPYSDIELYLMGMKSDQDLRDAGFGLDVYSGNDSEYTTDSWGTGYFYSTTKTSYSIDDIVSINGARIPDASSSQKHFKILTVAISREDATTHYYNDIIRAIDWFAGPKDDHTVPDLYNFSQATGGMGSLDTNVREALIPPIASGTTGDLIWDLYPDGTLTLFGEGEMEDYTESSMNVPWYRYRSDIRFVIIGDKVTKIGNMAFFAFTSLESIDIPAGVTTTIPPGVFMGCTGLKAINVHGDNPNYTSIDGVLYDKNQETLHSFPGGKSGDFIVSNTVKYIGALAFASCKEITSIHLPEGVTSIESQAFCFCDKLESINFPASLKYIASYVLGHAEKLTSVTVEWETPPDISPDVFLVVDLASVTLSVPKGMKARYEVAPVWKEFGAIVDYVTPGIVDVTKITLDYFNLSIFVNDTKQFTVVLHPSSATNKKVKWKSSNELVAIVSSSGLITALKGGTAIITAATEDGGVSATCEVKVSEEIANYYEVVNTVLIKYHGTERDLVIPENLGIKAIGNLAFTSNDKIASIRICEGVESIGMQAFLRCDRLQSVYIPSSLKTIGDHAFSLTMNLVEINVSPDNQAYSSLDGVLFNKEKTILLVYPKEKSGSSYIIPNTVEIIGPLAFFRNSRLSSVIIPNSVTKIESEAFYNCRFLSEINIPNSVTSIGLNAFMNCVGLTSLTISNSVTSFDYYVFAGCSSLKDVTVGHTTPLSVLGNIFDNVNLSAVVLHVPPGTKSLYQSAPVWRDFGAVEEIPDDSADLLIASGTFGPNNNLFWSLSQGLRLMIGGIGEMPDYDMGSNRPPWYDFQPEIHSVIMEDGVTTIGTAAFICCFAMASIVIPNSVTTIRNHAFHACFGLNSIEIPNSVISIEPDAFSVCSGLRSVTIPSSVTFIGEGAFAGCTGLISINMEENEIYTVDDDIIYNKDKTKIHTCPASRAGEFQISGSVKTIGANAFYGCQHLTSIIIPNSVTSIEQFAFQHDYRLTSITIPNSVTSIGEGAFNNCPALLSVTIPNSVTSIGALAFSNCSVMKNVIVGWMTPLSVPDNFYNIFRETDISVATLYVPPGTKSLYQSAPVWKDFGAVEEIPDDPADLLIASGTFGPNNNLFWSLSQGFRLMIGGIGKMPDYYDMESNRSPWYDFQPKIHSVIMEDGVTTIGSAAFIGCYAMASIVIPNSVTTIGSLAFHACHGLNSIEIPNSVIRIEPVAFSVCSGLRSVTIPSSVTFIGEGAFAGCTGLISINMEENEIYTVDDDIIYNKDKTKIHTCPASRAGEFQISGSVKTIGASAFYGCQHLTSIIIPNSVTSIEQFAFQYDDRLTSIIIPNSVKFIGEGAFHGCPALSSVTIPNSVTCIGNVAFSKCSVMKNVIVGWMTPLSVSDNIYNIFSETDISVATLHVPPGTRSLYKSASLWRKFGTIVEQEVNTFNAPTGFEALKESVNVWINKERLTVDSPLAETIRIYSIRGEIVYTFHKSAGRADFPIEKAKHAILIVKGDSGWVRKVE